MYKVLLLVTGMFTSGLSQAMLMDGSVLSWEPGDASFTFYPAELFAVSTDMLMHDGIVIGSTQPASGAHAGLPDGSENPGIDEPWIYFNTTGMHQTTSPIGIVSDDGMGNVELDFSGWSVIWWDMTIPLASTPTGFNPNSLAFLSCAVDCSIGDSFTLSYFSDSVPTLGTFPATDPYYMLNISGTITAIPVPPAIWLTVSGLSLLLAFSNRRS